MAGVVLAFLVLRKANLPATPSKPRTVKGKLSFLNEVYDDMHVDSSTCYFWNIGGVHFIISDSNRTDLLEQGATYQVYYLDPGEGQDKQILSLERVADKQGK